MVFSICFVGVICVYRYWRFWSVLWLQSMVVPTRSFLVHRKTYAPPPHSRILLQQVPPRHHRQQRNLHIIIDVRGQWLLPTGTSNALSSNHKMRGSHGFSAVVLFMALQVTIRIVGRKQGGHDWLDDACDMYLTRLKPSGLQVNTEWYKTDAALLKSIAEDGAKNTPVVLLDPSLGTPCTSETFANRVYQWLEVGGSRLVFVIGGGTCVRARVSTVTCVFVCLVACQSLHASFHTPHMRRLSSPCLFDIVFVAVVLFIFQNFTF